MRRLPPLKALRAFEVAGRHQSLKKAADELHVTTGAISHQIKLLEDYFGQPLFKRVNRTVEVTDAGLDFLKTTQRVLSQLQTGTLRLEFFTKPGLVVLDTSPAFASKWLMKRLPEFRQLHPEIDAWIYTKYSQEPLEHAEVDLAVWLGSGDWPGVECIKLFDDEVTPLYAPSLLEPGQTIETPADLCQFPLIHVEQMERREDWQSWYGEVGIEDAECVAGYNFNDSSLALDYALSGQGVVLGSAFLARDLIASGQLIRPFEQSLPTELNYYLVYRADKMDNDKVKAMANWLLAKLSE